MVEVFDKLSAWFDKEGGNWPGQGAYMYKMMKYFLSKTHERKWGETKRLKNKWSIFSFKSTNSIIWNNRKAIF